MTRSIAPLPLLLALLLAQLQPARAQARAAQSYLARTESATGTAELSLGAEPTLSLRLGGQAPQALEGLEVVGGYLFGPKRADLEPRSSAGIAGALRAKRVDVAEISASGLKVRSEPSTSGDEIWRLRRGDQVEVLEERGDWLRVPHGWIKSKGKRPYVTRKRLPRASELAQGEGVVFLRRAGRGWRGLRGGMRPISLRVASPQARPGKRILIVPDERSAEDGGGFRAYAEQVGRAYKGQGYQVVIADVDCWLDVVDELQAARGTPYARVVFIAHGGWDGPIFRGGMGQSQVSPTEDKETFAKLIAALRVGTQRHGRVLVSSCHAAGSANHEGSGGYRWVHDLAARTGRQVAGPAGTTSTEWTLRHALAGLEGRGTARQELHVARGTKVRVVRPGGTLAGARTMTAAEFKASRPEPAGGVTAGPGGGGGFTWIPEN